MRTVQGLESYPPDLGPSIVALGAFDGIHLGHRAILGTAAGRGRARGARVVACTFDRHPMEVLSPSRAPAPLATLAERLSLIAETGVDLTLVLAFTPELARVEPEAFVKEAVVAGTVTQGAGRGRTLGFPPANLDPERPLLLPTGVYACRAEIDGGTHQAVVNVGVRPTFGENALTIEAYLMDVAADFYGRPLRLHFIARLRGERKFAGVEELRAQIARDVEAARRELERTG